MDFDSLNFSELRDAEIVARMRQCNYEKFKTLVRMHLSFELDLNTDEFDLPCHEIVYEDKGKLKKWNRLSKKHKHGVVAAALATGAGGCAASGGGNKAPNNSNGQSGNNSPNEGLMQQIDAGFFFHLQELKEFLMLEKNLQQEGIFRKNGSSSRQNELRVDIQNDKPLELEDSGYSAHDCATVFKGYLADLPEPLLTDAHYPAHLQIAPLCIGINNYITDKFNQEKANTVHSAERVKKELHVLNSIQLLLLLLPDENRQLLHDIIDILNAVASQHFINKMGPDNLATLFAPHLICPRNLPPEALHYLAKKMSSIIAYMIIRGQDIFSVPSKLATDIRAYFLERKRKKTMSPEMALDESISDVSTVNTVYTFVDREKTAAAHNANTTETELAQLYAHIQSLPESSKKRRLIKQFNKQNGQGTPLQLQAMNRLKTSEITRSSKSLSDSIKKHIFHKGIISRTPKRQPVPEVTVGYNNQTPNNPSMKPHKQRVLFRSPNPQSFISQPSNTNTFSSLSSRELTATNINANNNHVPYNIQPHPFQKSISSTSLFVSQQHERNTKVAPSKLSEKGEQESSLSSIPMRCNMNANKRRSNASHSSRDGFPGISKSNSPRVTRQMSSEIQSHVNTSFTSISSSLLSLGLSGLDKHLETETEKQIITGGGPLDKKSVAWDDRIIDKEQTYNSNDLKSRYKSEPNLSMSNSICDTRTSSNVQGVHEAITPIFATGRFLTRKLMKGVSMGNLKFPFSTPESTKRLVRTVSSTLNRRSNDDSEIYQQVEGSFGISVRSDNVPLSQDVDDGMNEDNFEEEKCYSETEDDTYVRDNDGEDLRRGSTSLMAGSEMCTCDSSSNHSDTTNSFTKESITHKPLKLQHNGLYHCNMDLVRSTPSLLLGRRSMSPITKSTQRMPKAMQESIMTPRSRKPVMIVTSTISSTDQNQTENRRNLCNFEKRTRHKNDEIEDTVCDDDDDDKDNEDSVLELAALHPSTVPKENSSTVPKTEIVNEDATSLGDYLDIFKSQQLLHADLNCAHQHSVMLSLSSDSVFQTSSQSSEPKEANTDSLTGHFKEYLLNRSILTAPPEDTSFTSHSDDFNSSHEVEELEENQLSSSLLFCLDGNRPESEKTNDFTAATKDTFYRKDDGEKNITYTNDNSNTINLTKLKKSTVTCSSNNSSSSSTSSSTNNSTSVHIPIITNRLANNPFVILNNVRKRAANQDLDKISSTLFNSQVESPISTRSSYQRGLKSLHAATIKQLNLPNSRHTTLGNLSTITSSSSDKENLEQNENYMVTKKLLISEYPGETSF